jgi:hypothetical protein
MATKLLRDKLIEFYNTNKDKIDTCHFTFGNQQMFYKGWMEVINQKAQTVLSRLPKNERIEYLKKERIPKQYRGTPFGEAYDKLEYLLTKMLSFEYTEYSFMECIKYYKGCEKYVDDILVWLKEKETATEN